jgi:hypothetical protein
MKRLVILIFSALFAINGFSQKEVTKFLGIPVDGTKSEMENKLIEKGFKKVSGYDFLTGEFNGQIVTVLIVTNKDKVWRISVLDLYPTDEANIKLRFNQLCRQFEQNDKYWLPADDYSIPEEEDISYNMLAYNKEYEASYYQLPGNIGKKEIIDKTVYKMLEKYTSEEIDNPPLEKAEEIENYKSQLSSELIHNYVDFKRFVWFAIQEKNGKYRIALYYDNLYNRANGEDL